MLTERSWWPLGAYKEELYHHGILGQRWGQKNGPPYPLKVSDHSVAEKKAGWKKSLSKSEESVKTKKEKRKLTDEEKKRITKIALGAIAGATVIAGTIYLAKTGKLNLRPGKDLVEKYGGFTVDENGYALKSDLPLSKIKNFPNKLTEEWLQNDLVNVNINGGRKNCVACVVTEYLRSLGYNVTAKVRDSNFHISEVELLFSKFEMKNINSDSVSGIKEKLLSMGEGSSGLLGCQFTDDYIAQRKQLNPDFDITGHAVSWKILNGNAIFSDGQNNLFGDELIDRLLSITKSNGISYGRFDKSKIDPDFIDIFCDKL